MAKSSARSDLAYASQDDIGSSHCILYLLEEVQKAPHDHSKTSDGYAFDGWYPLKQLGGSTYLEAVAVD